MMDLVRQADLDQRAARTLRTVLERRRDDALGGDAAQPLHRLPRSGDELVVECYPDPLAAADEVEHALVARVAVLPQQEPLHAELHPLGVVRPALDVRALAALVVDRRHLGAIRLDQIHARNQAQALRGQGDRARVQLLGLVHVGGRRQLPAVAVDPPVRVAALDGIGRLDPLALDPLQVGEPRAVDVLVDHSAPAPAAACRRRRAGPAAREVPERTRRRPPV